MSALQSENHAPEPHPMDPRRGSHLSLGFSAFLCWLLNLPAMTEPAIVGMAVTGECVFVASADDPFFMLDPHSAAQPPVPPGTRPGPTPDTAAGTGTVRSRSAVILTAARTLLNTLEAGRALSTPVLRTAMIRPGDRVLEPSARTGILAVMAHCALHETASQRLYLNELAATRAGLFQALFPGVSVDRHNAESIADCLPGLVPSVVLMNPSFSASPGVEGARSG